MIQHEREEKVIETAILVIVCAIRALSESEYARGREEANGIIRRDGGRLLAQDSTVRHIIDAILRPTLRSHAALVEAETVERCIETIKSYRIFDWSSEQAIYEQLEEIIAAIRSLAGSKK